MDISLNSNGDISPYDYLRIVEPLIYNIITLEEIINKASMLETYSNVTIYREIKNINEILNFKVFEKSFGLQLQDDTLWEQYGDEICLFIPLTPKQREERLQEFLGQFVRTCTQPATTAPTKKDLILRKND